MLALSGALDLVNRYLDVLKASWAHRDEHAPVERRRDELEFLPASLELAETPVHPAPRWAMVGISALAVAATALALFGRLDIVASAKGKLVPSERVKLVQPAVTGVVRSIRVSDGQRVTAGELLMELDPTQAAADSSKAHSSRLAAAEAAARAGALLDAQQKGRPPVVPAIPGADPTDQREAQRFADGLMSEYRDKLASAQAELAKGEAELQSTRHEIEKLHATAPLARQQADDYQGLVERKYVAKTDYLDKEQSALQQEHELDAQQSHARQLEAAVSGQRSALSGIASQFRREQLDALDKARQQLSQNRDDETKAQTREGLMSLKSPVAGMVQQLAVHTLGGVVTTAQTLMEIVPDDAMEVEASIENKDIGFVHAGQEAVVKVEAFPYTRYGFLAGTVRSVSNDAVQDKKGGLSFVAHVRLPMSRMRIDQKWVNLTPGMATTVEVKTGTRSLARYFLDPLVQSSQESLRER
jgi:hemolysin D